MKAINWNGTFLSILLGSMIFTTSCSKHLSPTTKDYKQYEINNSIVEDSAIIAMYTPYRKQLDATMNEVIGHAAIYLTKENAPETLMGNFFCDAMLAIGKQLDPEVQISFGTKGGIRTEIKKGDVTIGHVFEVMPFENQISILTLSGQQVQDLAEFIADKNGQPVAGIRLEINNGHAQNISIAGQPLDIHKTYKLVTYDYLANGGDNLNALLNPLKRVDTDAKVREGLMSYIKDLTKNNQEINTQLDGRVKVIK